MPTSGAARRLGEMRAARQRVAVEQHVAPAFMGLQQLHRELPDRLADARARRALARELVSSALD
jgi:hypothetical protein